MQTITISCPLELGKSCTAKIGRSSYIGMAIQKGSKSAILQKEEEFLDSSLEVPMHGTTSDENAFHTANVSKNPSTEMHAQQARRKRTTLEDVHPQTKRTKDDKIQGKGAEITKERPATGNILCVSEHCGNGQEPILVNSAAILQNVKTLKSSSVNASRQIVQFRCFGNLHCKNGGGNIPPILVDFHCPK